MGAGIRAGVIGAIVALCCASAVAGPAPPCDGRPNPDYAPVGAPPRVEVWYAEDLDGWRPPSCAGWQRSSLDAVAAAAGRFADVGGAEAILARFAAVSAYARIQYWSPNGQDWRPLVLEAYALSRPAAQARRPDFTPAELKTGAPVFLYLGGGAMNDLVYRLEIRERSDDRLVVAVENADAVRLLGVPVLGEGGAQFLFEFDREEGATWRAYVMVRVASLLNAVARPPMQQYASRAVALLQHFAEQPAPR